MTQDRSGNECPCKSFLIASIKIKNQSEEQDNPTLMTESSNLKMEVPCSSQAHLDDRALNLWGLCLQQKAGGLLPSLMTCWDRRKLTVFSHCNYKT